MLIDLKLDLDTAYVIVSLITEPVTEAGVNLLLGVFSKQGLHVRVRPGDVQRVEQIRQEALIVLTGSPGRRAIIKKYTKGWVEGVPAKLAVRISPRGIAQAELELEVDPVMAFALGLAALYSQGYRKRLKQCAYVECRRWFLNTLEGRGRPRTCCSVPHLRRANVLASSPKYANHPLRVKQQNLIQRHR